MPDAHTSDQLVRNVMSASPVTIGPDATVRDVARLLADADIGAVPVVSDGKLAGIVTDRDLVVRVLAAGMGPDTTVGEIASADICSVTPDAPLAEAAQLLGQAQVRRLPVVDGEGRLVGIVTQADLARNAPHEADRHGRCAHQRARRPAPEGPGSGARRLVSGQRSAVELRRRRRLRPAVIVADRLARAAANVEERSDQRRRGARLLRVPGDPLGAAGHARRVRHRRRAAGRRAAAHAPRWHRPASAIALLTDSLVRTTQAGSGGVVMIVVGSLLAVWTLTGAMTTLMWALNIAFEREEDRGFVQQRLTAIKMLLLVGLAVSLAFGLLVLGPQLSEWVGRRHRRARSGELGLVDRGVADPARRPVRRLRRDPLPRAGRRRGPWPPGLDRRHRRRGDLAGRVGRASPSTRASSARTTRRGDRWRA